MVSTRKLFEKSKNSDQPVIIVCPDKDRWDLISREIIEVFKTREENIIRYEAGEGVKILREKLSNLNARPLDQGKKIFFILSTDKLSREEANTLLKVLEEPPDFARIFLFCTSLAMILPTIRSRCKKIIIGSNGSPISDSIFIFFQKRDFNAFLRKIKDIESQEIPAILESVLAELKAGKMGESELKLYKKAAEAFLLVSTTNCSRKLVMEELFVWWKAQDK